MSILSLNEYVDAIRHSYWVHTEFNFTSDIQDFKVHLDEQERTALERAMLAISQIEDLRLKHFGVTFIKECQNLKLVMLGRHSPSQK